VITWVFEGVLEPIGETPKDWRFTGQSLRRARLALSLTRDLEVNAPGVALALDLLDEIAQLQARLQRLGVR
jgi:chaperone modulatory protein CbpM